MVLKNNLTNFLKSLKERYVALKKPLKIGLYSSGGLICSIMAVNGLKGDRIYSGKINGVIVEYRENVGYSDKSVMHLKKDLREYELIDKDGVRLDWDNGFGEFKEAELERVIMKEGKKTYTFDIADIQSEGLNRFFVESVLEQSNKDYNIIKKTIYNRFREDYSQNVRNLKRGLKEIYNRAIHSKPPGHIKDSVKYDQFIDEYSKIR